MTVIKRIPNPKRLKHGIPYTTLLGNCLANRTLPSKAFGRSACSLRWKCEPISRYCNLNYPNQPVYRLIGFDAGLRDSARFSVARDATDKQRPHDEEIYPLRFARWTRGDCSNFCTMLGFPDEHSSCYFCVGMKPHELMGLSPEHYRRIVLVEAYAQDNLQTVNGFWRKSRMTDFIRKQGLLPETEVDYIWNRWVAADRIPPNQGVSAEDILSTECGEIKKPPGYRIDFYL
ncbi:MAG: hypothetical protein AAGD96_21090 [Chloroflexota bacterium]